MGRSAKQLHTRVRFLQETGRRFGLKSCWSRAVSHTALFPLISGERKKKGSLPTFRRNFPASWRETTRLRRRLLLPSGTRPWRPNIRGRFLCWRQRSRRSFGRRILPSRLPFHPTARIRLCWGNMKYQEMQSFRNMEASCWRF